MTGLGLRLALSGGRGAMAGVVLTALAVAAGTAILLFAISFTHAVEDRATREAWRDPQLLFDGRAFDDDSGLLMTVVDDRFVGEPLIRVLVGPLDDHAPIPPGIERLPEPGEAYVSPALVQRMAATPDDELDDRIGKVVGTIGNESLRSPQELVAIVGADPGSLLDGPHFTVERFPVDPRIPDIPPQLMLLVVLAVAGALAPVVVFVATATRLSAARREHRLAALRLVGATPAQVARIAAAEAVIPTAIGALGGLVLFFLVRPLVALVPLGEATWHPESIQPPLLEAVLLVAAVPVVGVVTAIVTLRRIVVTPLGVQRRATPPPPSIARLIPLMISVVVLVSALGLRPGWYSEGVFSLVVFGLAFAGIIGGIAYAGPWLTGLVGRIMHRLPGGAATLLASRRLADDPRGSFGSIAGVIMAVFVASAFFSFAEYAQGQQGDRTNLIRSGQIVAELPLQGGPSSEALPEELARMPGVDRVLPIRAGELYIEGGEFPQVSWIARCSDVLSFFDVPGAACSDVPVHTVHLDVAPGEHQYVPDRAALDGDRSQVTIQIPAGQAAPLLPADAPGVWLLPALIIDPALIGTDVEVAGISHLYMATDGAPSTVERVRTAIVGQHPQAVVHLAAERRTGPPEYAEFARIVQLGLIGTLVLAGCSLAVAVTTGMLERRRQFALLRSAGMPVGRLRALVLLQAGAPLVAVAVFSAALGIGLAQLILNLAVGEEVRMPEASLGVTLAGSLVGALLIVSLMLPPLERMTRPESIRVE